MILPDVVCDKCITSLVIVSSSLNGNKDTYEILWWLNKVIAVKYLLWDIGRNVDFASTLCAKQTWT